MADKTLQRHASFLIFERHAMFRNSQPPNRGANRNISTISLESHQELPQDIVTARVNLGPELFNRIPGGTKLPILPHPKVELGDLVMATCNGILSHAGMITELPKGDDTSEILVDLWPVTGSIQFGVEDSTAVRLSGRALRYRFQAITNQLSFTGSLSKLVQNDAEHYRIQIGAVAPEILREIFWSESEIQQIEANQVAQARYEELATALIESL